VAEERTNDASLMYGRMVGNLQQQLHQQAQAASAANAANAARVQKEQEKVQSMVALEQHHHHQRLVHLTTRVREVFMIHVGGTRCVTSSTDNIMKIQARITLTVEFIRAVFFYFYCMWKYNDEYDQD
jgi:hypothetical protein